MQYNSDSVSSHTDLDSVRFLQVSQRQDECRAAADEPERSRGADAGGSFIRMNDDQWLRVSDYVCVCGEELRETQVSPFGPKIYIVKCTFLEIYFFKHAQEKKNIIILIIIVIQ